MKTKRYFNSARGALAKLIKGDSKILLQKLLPMISNNSVLFNSIPQNKKYW